MSSYSDLGMMIEAYLKTQPAQEVLFYNQVSMLLGWRTIQYFIQFCYSMCFDYTSQILERSIDLHTFAINTINLNYKLALSIERDKKLW